MNTKSIPARQHSTLPMGQAALTNYMNRMFLYSICGFLAFFGIAWGLGSLQQPTATVPNTAALNAIVSSRS